MQGGVELATDDTDEYGNAERDHDPYHRDAAGALEFFLFADRHKAEKYLRHTEVAESPCQHGANAENAVFRNRAEDRLACLYELLTVGIERRCCEAEEFQKSGNALRVFKDSADAACTYRADDDDDRQCSDHHDRLHEVRNALREESAENGVEQYKDRAHDHHGYIRCAEQGGKELTAGNKAAGCVYREEDQDKRSRNGHDDLLLLTEAVGEEFGQGDGVVCAHAVAAQTLGDDEPVEIGADRKTDGSPCRVSETAPVGNAGQTH